MAAGAETLKPSLKSHLTGIQSHYCIVVGRAQSNQLSVPTANRALLSTSLLGFLH
jgi:hypothetical protein